MGKQGLIKCAHCDTEILKNNCDISRAKRDGHNMYCSVTCRSEYRKLFPPKVSDEARKKILEAGRRGNATMKSRRKPLEELKSFHKIRAVIFEERGRKCEECGWNKENPFNGIIPVQVDHIDGDRTNNTRENLKVLCPSCHSLTKYFMFYGQSHAGTYGQKGTKRPRTTKNHR